MVASPHQQLFPLPGQTPRFPHNSDNSHFLGHYTDPSSQRSADLYFQHSETHGPSVIARFGPDADYRSGFSSSFGADPALFEARVRAQFINLTPYPVAYAARHLVCSCHAALKEFQQKAGSFSPNPRHPPATLPPYLFS